VRPKGGCNDVIDAVDGLKAADDLHWVYGIGLIDRDNRDEAEVVRLRSRGIYALNVCSVEAVYYGRAAREAIATQQAESLGRQADELLSGAENAALATIDNDTIERLCALRCERRVRFTVMGQLPSADQIRGGTASSISFNPAGYLATELGAARALISAGSLDGLLAQYQLRRSGAYTAMAARLLFRNKELYQDAVIARARRDDQLKAALRQSLEPLSSALAG
jgi:hypothetical protein